MVLETTKRGRPAEYNWERIRADYESGAFSVAMLAKKYGASQQAIRNRVNSTWAIGNTPKLVANRTKERVIFADPKVSRDQAIDAVVETNVRIIREHRGISGRGRAISMRMLAELEETMDNMPALEELAKAAVLGDEKLLGQLVARLSTGARAGVLKDIATATRIWIELERAAFGLDGEKEDDLERWTDERLDNRISELLRKGRTAPAT